MIVGKELGPYLVEKELGSGAMGTVFRAKNKKSGDRVAIKLMSLALGSSETAVKRFVREVDILRQLQHPNIVRYKGSGRYHGSPFYIMEYVEGESLDHILHRKKRLSWDEVVDLGIHLCAALQHAHDKGIVHRDLKPSNLMFLQDGVVKLTDFGIAKDTDVTALTAANSTVGTAAYMSPEQCRGVRDITAKSDLYSMGIMFYELLTGRKPFVGETAMEVFLQHANKTDYKRPGEYVLKIPEKLDDLVCQLMAKDPSQRPPNARAVGDLLQLIKNREAQKSGGKKPAPKKDDEQTIAEQMLEEEKTAARILLGKKKRQEEPAAFYTKGWFTISALLLIAILALASVYFAFLRTPGADALYARADRLMRSESADDRKSAREGPIADFLRYYPQHEKVTLVQGLADQYDFELLDAQMHRRRKKMAVGGKDATEEQAARDTLDEEDIGKLPDALKHWTELSKKKGNADPEIHAWGLVGERYAKKLQEVKDRYLQLRLKIETERTTEKKTAGDSEFETLALDAVRAEIAAERTKTPEDPEPFLVRARNQWDELKKAGEVKDELRSWYLLGAWRGREIRQGKWTK